MQEEQMGKFWVGVTCGCEVTSICCRVLPRTGETVVVAFPGDENYREFLVKEVRHIDHFTAASFQKEGEPPLGAKDAPETCVQLIVIEK